MNNNDLAHKIFNALFDDDDLNEMYSAGFIAQPLGYQVSSVAMIEVELDNNHDRMMEEIAELNEFVKKVSELGVETFHFETQGGDEDCFEYVHTDIVDDAIELLTKLNQEWEE
jgi:DNA-binding Lrp family transcriptional regulator